MIIDVVLTTYNGERFIIEQLDSILNQTVKPDRVIIKDDGSKDNTCIIIEEYIKKNSLSTWELHRNESNVGWKKNFIEALDMSSGDIVFLADQDDIWIEDKIESMSKIMTENESIMVLSGNSINFYSSDNNSVSSKLYSFKYRKFNLDGIWKGKGLISKLNRLLKEKKTNSDKVEQVVFDEGLFSVQRQGCVMATRQCVIREILPLWTPDCPHDTLLWFYAAMNDMLFLYEKYVINYRHHDNNTGFQDTIGNGLCAATELKKIEEFQSRLVRLKHILSNSEVNEKNIKLNVLNNINEYNDYRVDFLTNKKLKTGLSIIRKGKYVGKRQVIFDWLLTYLT